jgi:hypothetical protein
MTEDLFFPPQNNPSLEKGTGVPMSNLWEMGLLMSRKCSNVDMGELVFTLGDPMPKE